MCFHFQEMIDTLVPVARQKKVANCGPPGESPNPAHATGFWFPENFFRQRAAYYGKPSLISVRINGGSARALLGVKRAALLQAEQFVPLGNRRACVAGSAARGILFQPPDLTPAWAHHDRPCQAF